MDPEEEAPWIKPGNTTILRENMVFTLKATITVPDVGGLRTEHIVRLSAGGIETLIASHWSCTGDRSRTAATENNLGLGRDVMTAIVVSQSIERSMFRRVMLSSVIGTAIEWYDFFLYATASALVFGQLFPALTRRPGRLLRSAP